MSLDKSVNSHTDEILSSMNKAYFTINNELDSTAK